MDLTAAIKEIQSLTERATGSTFREIDIEDPKGGKFKLPIAIVQDETGRKSAVSLAKAVHEGIALATENRLKFADGPDRREGVANHQALKSFIDHANRFKAENSTVWANLQERRIVSVLDYHDTGAASKAKWGRHRGVYPCPLSEAWQAWGGKEGLELSQDDFAELLDSRDRELAEGTFEDGKKSPPPSFLVSLANNLETFSSSKAKKERDAQTGRLMLSYAAESGVAPGSVTPPPAFLITIPVFEDDDARILEVRLRVTVEDGEPTFHVRIHAAGDVLRKTFTEICGFVAQETTLPIFLGTPE